MRPLILVLLALMVTARAQAQQACPLTRWFDYQGKTVSTTLFRTSNETAYLYSSPHVALDADGAPNAYHPKDPTDCPRGAQYKGLDCPGNAGYKGPKSEGWKNVLYALPEKPNQPYEQEKGDFAGYFLSMTALVDGSKKDHKDPARYVDSRNVPYLVFPGLFYAITGTGEMGDLGVAVNMQTGAKSAFVVADVGGKKDDLGEMSLALATALGGTNPNPRTGTGAPAGPIAYFVFPKSSRLHHWPIENSELTKAAFALLEGVGGNDVLNACKDDLR